MYRKYQIRFPSRLGLVKAIAFAILIPASRLATLLLTNKDLGFSRWMVLFSPHCCSRQMLFGLGIARCGRKGLPVESTAPAVILRSSLGLGLAFGWLGRS